jgi:hypothetical protein
MSYPNLNIREVRRHPAVITDPADLQPGKEVAMGYIIPPIGRRVRFGQTIAGALLSRPGTQSRGQAMRQGYSFTPTWGIVVDQRGTVKWVNTDDALGEYPYASFDITHTTEGVPLRRILGNAATSMDALAECIQNMPRALNEDEEPSTIGLITGFDTLGLAPARDLGYDRFVVDLAKLDK